MEIYENIRKYMKIDIVHDFAFILYVLSCILNVWTCFFTVFCVFVVFGPIQKDARRKTMHLGGTQTSRSFTRTRLVTKTMDGLNPQNVNPINYNSTFGSASPVAGWMAGFLNSYMASCLVSPSMLPQVHGRWMT